MTVVRKPTTTRGRDVKKPSRPASKRRAALIRAPKRGQRCPQCGKGKLDYDGFLNLTCPACGYSGAGGGCT